MGERGPLPSNVHPIGGSPGHHKPERRPQPVRGTPSVPNWLGSEAREECERVTPELERLGLLTVLDRGILTAYSESWALLVKAGIALEADEKGASSRIRLANVLYRDNATALGLTPNS